ncbi:MAG: DUF1499 domain-containing protein [Rhodobacteraceae bacterium]|nr:DUF1499 domain-containing protein [Paracoccaceae bacterium]
MQRMALYMILAVFLVIGAFYVRAVTASHDPAEWHIDPLTVERPASPNTYYVAPQSLVEDRVDLEAPIYAVPAAIMARAFNDYVVTQPNALIVEGHAETLWLTFVQRTPALKMPDYITVKFIDLEGGKSTIAIYSRSRFGYGDLGVNKARVDLWLQSLASFEE